MKTSEELDDIASLALKNCEPEFLDLAFECAVAICTLLPSFDGSMLTMLLQRIDPDCWPNKSKRAYHLRSDRLHVEATFAMQRNYFSSAARMYFRRLAIDHGKTASTRPRTHDKVLRYSSNLLGTSQKIDPRIRAAMIALGWIEA